jgi:hypothetical protein
MGHFTAPRDRDDEAYEDARQRKLDALIEGQRVGAQGLSASLNPFLRIEPEHAEWAEGWRRGSAQHAREQLGRRAA